MPFETDLMVELLISVNSALSDIIKEKRAVIESAAEILATYGFCQKILEPEPDII